MINTRFFSAEGFLKSVYCAVILLSVVLLFARFFDPVSSMGFNYSDSSLFDEVVYSALAVKMVGFPFVVENDSVTSLPLYSPIQNIASRISFEFLGVNYVSLRITGLIAYLCCLALAFSIAKTMNLNNSSQLGVVALLSADPGLWYFGGTNHPVIFQCLGIMTFILVAVRMPHRPVVLGCVASVAFFLTYPPNAFLVLAGGLLFLFQGHISHFRRLQLCCLYVMGTLIGLGLSESAVALAFDRVGIVEGIFWALTTYSGRISVASNPINSFRSLSTLISPPLVMLTLFSIGYGVRRLFFTADDPPPGLKVLLICVATFIIQAKFIDDYPIRKMVVFTPIIMVLVTYCLMDKQSNAWPRWYMLFITSFAGIAGLHELFRHRVWLSDFIDPIVVLLTLLIIGGLLLARYLPFFASRLSGFDFVIPCLLLFASCWVNIEVFRQMKGDQHSNRSLIELAERTSDGCVVGYGHATYLAGGGTPLFVPHIHSKDFISGQIDRYVKVGNCRFLYLLMDFKLNEASEKVLFYGRTWVRLESMETEDIQNQYKLSLFKEVP